MKIIILVIVFSYSLSSYSQTTTKNAYEYFNWLGCETWSKENRKDNYLFSVYMDSDKVVFEEMKNYPNGVWSEDAQSTLEISSNKSEIYRIKSSSLSITMHFRPYERNPFLVTGFGFKDNIVHEGECVRTIIR